MAKPAKQTSVDRSRRALLFGRRGRPPPLRPPWSKDESLFTAHCTQCEDCVRACETGIIVRGDGGFPEVDFNQGECTFCGACEQVCGEGAFRDAAQEPPWNYVAMVGDGCLAFQGVYCRNCGESCEAQAIRFHFNVNRVPEPTVETDACTGCGACVENCPTQAVTIGQQI